MKTKFIVEEKKGIRKDTHTTLSIRIEKSVIKDFDRLSRKSSWSRNALIGMALKYALDNLKFIPDEKTKDSHLKKKKSL